MFNLILSVTNSKLVFQKDFFVNESESFFQMNDIAVVQVFLRIVLELELEVLAKNHILLQYISHYS